MVGKMSDLDHTEPCDFCREGHVIMRNRKIAFRQWTNRGYIHCHAEIPIGLCDSAAGSIGTRRRKRSSMRSCGANTTSCRDQAEA
jgi:hypothetical protein